MNGLKVWIGRGVGFYWGAARITNPNHRIYFRIGWGGDLVPVEIGFIRYFFCIGKL